MLQSFSPSLGPETTAMSMSPPRSGAGLHQEDRGLLQEARRQNGCTGTLCAYCAHLRTLCGGRGQHALCRVCYILYRTQILHDWFSAYWILQRALSFHSHLYACHGGVGQPAISKACLPPALLNVACCN